MGCREDESLPEEEKEQSPPRPQGLWEGGAQERLVRAPVGLSVPQLSP